MPTLTLTCEEWWWVQNLVRRTDHLGEVWDREDMARIHGAILALTGGPAAATHALEVSDGLLWQIEAQVPQTLDLGRSNLGRHILLAVMRALQRTEVRDELPAVFRDLDPGADVAGPDRDPGAAAESGGDLPAAKAGPA